MKRKLLTATLIACMSLSLLACGKKEEVQPTSSDKESVSPNNEDDFTQQEEEQITYSEYLGKERVIVYQDIYNRTIGKDTVPSRLYFFEDGQVTMVDSNKFDNLTMGELSKMTDDEIWERFYELELVSSPVEFVVTTDGTGNTVSIETIVFLSTDTSRSNTCEYIELIEKCDESQIYDSLYYAYSSDNMYFFIREDVNLIFDSLDNTNIHIDVDYSDYETLFSAEELSSLQKALGTPMDPSMFETIYCLLTDMITLDEAIQWTESAGLNTEELTQRIDIIQMAIEEEWLPKEIKEYCLEQGFEPNEMISLIENIKAK